MLVRKTMIIFPVLLVLYLWTVSCKKTPKPSSVKTSPFTGCRISQIVQFGYDTTTGKTVYQFIYNNDGTVAKIISPPQKGQDSFARVFTYKPNCIIVYATDNSLPYSKDSLLFDDNNRVVFIDHYTYNGSPQPNQVWDKYQYDNLGNMVLQTSHSNGASTTATYSWKNGDLQWNTSGTDFVDYYYDTTLYNIGNIFTRITDFVSYGRTVLPPSKHLRSYSIEDGADSVIYTYQLDNTGKVTYLNISISLTPVTEITYDCE
jgi:hypothetical protein